MHTTTTTPIKFTPSACIVNYYHAKSIMGGHVDDLELATDKPVISLSVGLPAIFLLGGTTKDDGPIIPILIRPGDVLVMGGASRRKYHGMARVIPAGVVPGVAPNVAALRATVTTVPDQDHVKDFLTRHRININVRQVLPDGMNCIPTNDI
jgi:alkylated DNA repair protein alkB family protein 1